MADALIPALRPDFYGQLAATDAYQCRARRLFERGQVVAVEGNQADVRVGYDARGNALELKQVPITSGYVPSVGDWVAIQYEAGHSSAPWVTGPSMAADETSDSAGIGVFPVRDTQPPDPQRSAIYFDESLETWRGWDGADWVNFSGKLHNSLPDLQGGAAGEYYHLTADEYAAIGGGAFPATAVIYADANGKLAGDASKLKWTGAQLQLTSGSAAMPAIARVSYADDGMFWPGDGALAVALGGVEIARFTADGRLGIGIAPAQTFHAFNASAMTVALIESNDGQAILDLDGGGASGECRIQFRDDSAGIFRFRYVHSEGFAALYDDINNYDVAQFPTDNHGQVLLRAGAAAWPTIARQGYPDDGLFWPGDGLLAVALGGTERFRWSGNDVGMAATGRLYLDGVACSGNTYIRERTLDTVAITAGGYDQFEVRSDHQYARPTTYTPGSDGVFGFRTTDNALEHRVGSVVHRNGLCVYSGSYASDSTWSLTERTLDLFTIPAAYWKVGKRIQVRATVEAQASTGASGSVTLRVKIGSTVVMEKSMAATSGLGRAGHFDFDMDFIVGAVAASGNTIYPARTIRSFTSTSGADFGNIQNVGAHEMYPMKPTTAEGLAIDTTAAQAISVVYLNSGNGSVTVLLQGLTIYST
jgi:hypothetical protein